MDGSEGGQIPDKKMLCAVNFSLMIWLNFVLLVQWRLIQFDSTVRLQLNNRWHRIKQADNVENIDLKKIQGQRTWMSYL